MNEFIMAMAAFTWIVLGLCGVAIYAIDCQLRFGKSLFVAMGYSWYVIFGLLLVTAGPVSLFFALLMLKEGVTTKDGYQPIATGNVPQPPQGGSVATKVR